MQIRINSISAFLLILSAMLVPMYFTDFRLPTGGVIIRLADIISLAIIGLFVAFNWKGQLNLYLPKGFLFLFVFIVYCFLNTLWHSNIIKALIATSQWLMIIFTLSIVYSHSILQPERFTKIFFNTLLSICFFVVVYHFLQGDFIRYKHLGDAKYILALTGVLILSYTYYFQNKKYTLALCILYPFILLSLERKGILAFHLVLFVYLCFSMKSFTRVSVLIALAIGFILVLTTPGALDFSNFRVFEFGQYEMLRLDENVAVWNSNYHRQSLLENGWDIFKDNWIFGVGAKMLPASMLDYYHSSGLALYTHNVFLDTLIEQGIVGLFLLLIPYFIYIGSGCVKLGRGAVCFISLCLYSGTMLFFMSGGAPSMVLFYLPLFTGFLNLNSGK